MHETGPLARSDWRGDPRHRQPVGLFTGSDASGNENRVRPARNHRRK